ncbi:hypothetical protein FEM48_Zijuj06G0207200 [Ziziphus jujuba var. spinosa]|uniref:Lipoxygenase domain-containing protein n=1 Tax=Ziziphus jujuba var. spinosa TaxID=714518 RepID=A0A978VBI5_ZIZJJ|nr:hypothetical protein FEM48_Zijuj06G0207200 [Ziziphus jujuba var. spinosa]
MIFTSQNQAVLDILSNHSQDEEYLGDQSEATWDEDPVIKAAFEHFNGRFHSLHHTQFRTNYSLFMPFYDYMYRTMDKSSDTLYETSLEKGEDSPDVVHLTHLTKPDSIYQLRLGLASVASHPYVSKCIPKGTTQVLLRGNLTKVAYAIAKALCQKGIQVWLVGEGWAEGEQMKARKETLFIPFSHFPPNKLRAKIAFITPLLPGPLDSPRISTLVRDIISTKRACRVGSKPFIDAMNVKGMFAFGQFSDPFAMDDLLEANCTKQRLVHRFSGIVEGEYH